jgi:hypothetical protein
MYARLAALSTAAVLGLGAALIGAGPAMAATRPTLSGPATTTGYGPVTMTGTAAPGATVRLIEAAYTFRTDMNPSVDYGNAEDILTTTADSSGRFTLRRIMDSGFVFAAEAEGLRSDVITIDMIANPTMRVTTSGTSVTFDVVSDPGQPWLPVAIQRQNGSAWTTVAEGWTAESGVYSTVVTGEAAGSTQHYRAAVGPDAANGVRLGYTATVGLVIGGSGTPTTTQPTTAPTTRPTTTPPTTRPTTTPPTTRPTTTPPTTRPTTPTPKPTTTTAPKPTTPAPAQPKAGDVRFSLVQYNPPGTDAKNNAGYNKEYFRITNYTNKTINLKFWTVKDRAGNTYRFKTDFYLRAKKNVYVLTGKGTDGKPDNYRYWGASYYIWNNTGDAAYLRTGSNKLIDSCSWGNGSGKTYC